MVKSIIYTLTAIALCAVFFIFTDYYVHTQFDDFHGAVETLYEKVENGTANREDAYAVRAMWTDKKSKLHVFLPHNDISYVDHLLNETCGLIYTENYELALSKTEDLLAISTTLPDSYTVRLENVL